MPADTKQEVVLAPVTNDGEMMQALALREIVFIEEQNVPEGIERDAEDAQAFHVLALQGGHAIGTGRLVELKEAPLGNQGRWGKIGRMAVLKANRRGGIGAKLLTRLEEEAKKRGMTGLILHAQVTALEFYRRMGYLPVGEIFDEANMPHQKMVKRLG